MNPGRLKYRCTVERQVSGQDDSGQPTETLDTVAKFRANKITPKVTDQPARLGDQEREIRRVIFRRRVTSSQLIQAGDCLKESPRRGTRETLWDITGINDVPGGIYEDIICEWVS